MWCMMSQRRQFCVEVLGERVGLFKALSDFTRRSYFCSYFCLCFCFALFVLFVFSFSFIVVVFLVFVVRRDLEMGGSMPMRFSGPLIAGRC